MRRTASPLPPREQATPTAEEVRLRRRALATQVEGLTAEEMDLRVTRRRGVNPGGSSGA